MANKRPDGDGLVRKRKDGRWEGRIVVGHKANGTPIFRSVFAKTQKMLMENYDILVTAETKLAMLKALGKVSDPYITTGDYMEALGTPGVGSTGGEWMVIGLA